MLKACWQVTEQIQVPWVDRSLVDAPNVFPTVQTFYVFSRWRSAHCEHHSSALRYWWRAIASNSLAAPFMNLQRPIWTLLIPVIGKSNQLHILNHTSPSLLCQAVHLSENV